MLELTDVHLHAESVSTTSTGFEHAFGAGEITVVLGANQSGKTDLCRLVAGLNTHARGQVRLDGVDLSAAATGDRPVSMVYQAFVNYPNLTVAQNIASPLRARRENSASVATRVRELAEKLGIDALLERYPHELSGGQQQRLAIARAMAKQARVLLLDEPLVNLDFKLREALEVELRDLLHAAGTVVVYTSSDPRDAFNLGDQLLLLDQGHKIQAGTPMQVYSAPSSPRAMELLAEPRINRFQFDGGLCALRPEHVQINPIAAAAGLDFDLQVTAFETNGDESFIHGEVAGEEWVVRSSGMHVVSAGQSLQVFAQAGDVVRF